MLNEKTYTPAEVAERVKRDLRARGPLFEAAQQIGISATALSNHLNGKRYLTAKQARIFHNAFGYSVEFLVSGKGELMAEDARFLNPDGIEVPDTLENNADLFELFAKDYRRLLKMEAQYTDLCNKVRELIAALQAFLKKDDGEEPPRQIDLDDYLAGIKPAGE